MCNITVLIASIHWNNVQLHFSLRINRTDMHAHLQLSVPINDAWPHLTHVTSYDPKTAFPYWGSHQDARDALLGAQLPTHNERTTVHAIEMSCIKENSHRIVSLFIISHFPIPAKQTMHNAQSKIILHRSFTLILFTKTALISNFEKNPLEMNHYHFVYMIESILFILSFSIFNCHVSLWFQTSTVG